MPALNLYIYVSMIMSSILTYVVISVIRPLKFSKSSTENEDKRSEKVSTWSLWNVIKFVMLTLSWSRKNPTHGDTAHTKQVKYVNEKMDSKDAYILPIVGKILVLATSPKYIREILTNTFCENRVTKSGIKHPKGIFFHPGDETWKELRKYTIRNLTRLGLGKKDKMDSIQSEVLDDLLDRLEYFRNSTGNKIEVNDLFKVHVLNIIWKIVGGNKFSEDDEEFQFLKKHVSAATETNILNLASNGIFSKVFLRGLRKIGLNFLTAADSSRAIQMYFKNFIQTLEAKTDFSEHGDTFIDSILVEIEKHKNDKKMNKIYNEDQLAIVLTDLFFGGIDTTGNYMECFMMYMILNPDVQVKFQQEIDRVIGKDCLPIHSMHKKSMPYTMATIAEVHRLGNILPMILRSIIEDCKIGSNMYKMDTQIYTFMTFIRMDERYWGDPTVFRPERFLDFQNNLLMDRVNSVMAFGAGARVCPGENVAMSTIFTFVTGILQKFTVSRSNEKEFVGLSKRFAIVSRPEPFYVSLHSRW